MSTANSGTVTRLLHELSAGDQEALRQVLPLVYREMRGLAARALRRERRDCTLTPTVLVHEAYLRLVDQHAVQWQHRAHFLGLAAQMMRRILIDHARRRTAAKRLGKHRRVDLPADALSVDSKVAEWLAIDDALHRLAELDARQSRIVELRFFGGLTVEETAEVLGVSPATVKREWMVAQAWLRREIV